VYDTKVDSSSPADPECAWSLDKGAEAGGESSGEAVHQSDLKSVAGPCQVGTAWIYLNENGKS